MPQLNPGVEHAGQILHQLPEVHPLVGGEVEENLAAVEGALGGHQLHIQAVVLNLLHTHLKGPALLGPVVGVDLLILGRGLAQNLPQGCHGILGPDGVVAPGADAELHPPGSVHNHMVPQGEFFPVGVKIIYLLSRPELHVHNLQGLLPDRVHKFFHWVYSFIR